MYHTEIKWEGEGGIEALRFATTPRFCYVTIVVCASTSL